MGIERQTERERDGYREIEEGEQQIRKKWVERKREREREHAYKNGLVERNNKIIEKIDYLNKRGVFCKSGCVK